MKSSLSLTAIFAITLLRAAAQPNPVEMELFPPELLFGQREALGLDDTQLQDMQATMQEAQPQFEKLNGEMQEKVAALKAVMQQEKLDPADAEKKLRAVLAVETELKAVQFRTMLALRNKLTVAQLDKARQLRQQMQQTAGNDPRQGLPERLGRKFEQLKAALQERAFGGGPPEEIVKQVGEIQRLAQGGNPLEAERRIDALIAQLREGKPKP